MKLTQDEADLFFDLMWRLQCYTNNKYKIITPIKSLDNYEKLPLEEKSKVRDYLFENIAEIVDCFAQDNSFDLDQDKIMIIRGWKQFIKSIVIPINFRMVFDLRCSKNSFIRKGIDQKKI